MFDLLQAEKITKSFGDLVLFNEISLSIPKGRKTALLARNGAGKTTLLNIIAGIDSCEAGKIILRNDIRIGYLVQNPEYNKDLTAFEIIYGSFKNVHDLIIKYEQAVENGDKDQINELSNNLDSLGAWDVEVRVKQIISGMGISDPNKKFGLLSGGQKKRVALASLLVLNPDLLILDEPTNHLDLEMIEWLEDFLKNKCETLLMVTHDRYFLDRVCNEIIELDDKTLFSYKGNYSYFLEKRDERIQNFNSEMDKARNLLRRELEWMRKMPKARTTKSKSRIDAFYDLQEKADKKMDTSSVKINVSSSRLGKKILEIAYLNKSYGNNVLIKDFTYIFRRMEKVGIIGPNGCGKTTLLNILAGEIEVDSGKFDFGETVKIGYYKQDDPKINTNLKVIDIVREKADVVTLADGNKLSVSQFLNYFLFPPAMQNQYAYKLSGGELRRLYLVTVLMQNPNFLILDEPTNNLDIMTLQVLENYLSSFNGCVVVVSHDRFFLDKVADHLFVFKGDGIIKDYPGNYSEYRQSEAEKEKQKKAVKINIQKNTEEIKIKNNYSNRLSYKEKIEKENIELELEQLNSEKLDLETKLNSGTLDSDLLIASSERLGKVIELIDEKELRWLDLSEKDN